VFLEQRWRERKKAETIEELKNNLWGDSSSLRSRAWNWSISFSEPHDGSILREDGGDDPV